jgi:uncharacterized Tic20 family protein
LPAAGWYHDGTTLRWWDGSSWGPVAPPGSFGSPPSDPIRDGSTLAVLSHVGFIIAAVVLALVIRLTEGNKNDYTRHHSSEALNFQLTFLIVWIVGILTAVGTSTAIGSTDDENGSAWILLPFLALFGVYAAGMALAIVGAVRANRGLWWRYPVSIRFVRGARPKQ